METKTDIKLELFQRLAPLLQFSVDETVKEQLTAAALSLGALDPYHTTPEMARYLILLDGWAKMQALQPTLYVFATPELLYLFNAVTAYMELWGHVIRKIANGEIVSENTPEYEAFLVEFASVGVEVERSLNRKRKAYDSVEDMVNAMMVTENE